MSLQAQTALLAALLSVTLGASLLLRRRGEGIARWYAALTTNLSLWWVASFFARFAVQSGLWRDVMLILIAPLPVTALGFYRRLLTLGGDDEQAASQAWRAAVFSGALLLALAYFLPDFLVQDLDAVDRLCRAVILLSLGFGLYFVWRRAQRTPSRTESVRLSYLFFGGLITGVLILSDVFTHAGLGDVTAVVYLYLLSQSILRRRLLDLKEILGKMASLAIEAALVAALYGALTSPAWLSQNLGLFALNGFVASVVLLLLVDPMRERVEDWVSRRLFREKASFAREVVALAKDLARIIDPPTMARRIVSALERTDRVTHASVYVLDDSGHNFARLGRLGPETALGPDDPAVRPALDRLARGEILITDAIESERNELDRGGKERGKLMEDYAAELGALARSLRGMEAGIAVPFSRDGKLLGFMTLRDERLREAYSREEISMLREVAAQATLVIENSRSYEQQKQRDRLAALGEMAAGLAHEIRNPLGAIKGAAQLVQTAQDPSQTEEFLQIIVEEADRLNTVVRQFLDYARPLRLSLQPVNIRQVLRRAVALLGEEAEGVEIEVDIEEGLPLAQGDAELLTQVFLNLAQNACQAMDGQGILGISAVLSGDKSFIVCRVEDTGPGIPPEILPSLFVPFFTTKEKGTGLGLAISQRIIERHGGTIGARSLPGQGAAFIVRLPVAAQKAEKEEKTPSE